LSPSRSRRNLAPAGRAPALLLVGHDAVASRCLGLVERLVGSLDDLLRLALLGAALGHADADGDRHEAAGRALAPLLTSTGRVLRTVLLIAQGHLVVLDVAAQHFQVRQAVLQALAREQHGELLATVAVGRAAAGDLAQL